MLAHARTHSFNSIFKTFVPLYFLAFQNHVKYFTCCNNTTTTTTTKNAFTFFSLSLSLEMGIKSTRQFEFVHLQIFLYFRLIQPRLLTAISPPNHFRGKKYNILLLLHDSHLWYTKIIYIVGSCIIIFFF